MRIGRSVALIVVLFAGVAFGFEPLRLSLEPEQESVYAPPAPALAEEGTNEGAAHVDARVDYTTAYVYRGLHILKPPGGSDRPNLQFDDKLSFDLGKAPHPFVGFFLNVNDADPVSRFQELRPYFGADWEIKPFLLTFGNNNYIYPDRDAMNTAEAFGRILMNDSFLWKTEKPILSPYINGAYDFNKYNGFYFELGVSHDFVIEDTGITLTALAQVAYVIHFREFAEPGFKGTGLQHYQVGLVGSYSLNALLNVPRRYGEWKWQAYVYYTDNIEDHLRGATRTWAGTGLAFSY